MDKKSKILVLSILIIGLLVLVYNNSVDKESPSNEGGIEKSIEKDVDADRDTDKQKTL